MAPVRRRLLGLACVLLLGLPGCGSGERNGGARGAEAGGDLAPEFTLPDLAGRPVSLSDYRGRTVVLDFWATWCPPCVFQVPELNRLSKAHEERGDLVVIGVSVDAGGLEAVKPWVEEQGVTYTVVLGDEQLAYDFGALGFPTMAIVRPDGRLDSLHVGLMDYDTLEQLVSGLGEDRSS